MRVAFGWVHRAARVLGLKGGTGADIRHRLGGLPGAMTRHRASAGNLGPAVDHFAKVSRSYWPGLFACYDTADVPRANTELEQAFGSHRYHERRASGRKGASPSLVLRGSAKLIAGLATRARRVTADDLAGADRPRRRQLRAELDERRQRRTDRRRFRQNPEICLKGLEVKLRQSRLPAQKKRPLTRLLRNRPLPDGERCSDRAATVADPSDSGTDAESGSATPAVQMVAISDPRAESHSATPPPADGIEQPE